ncbi:MBOAT family protein [Mangrovibacterium marinum]|uniref:D-alanyl-lipoteichoic acid acyltransferase DltB (MBOAT superfamily) n=1 Tax=Mangrovibacterium marinum TaxID=1639118 RepID=A0A2T5BYJ5_9BACT|nr:MBOAT family O-acyltransferase [Mangrovibacterium marinum]PTN07312.1 D-alanyl-lipoteichoic acid acyltransferase DltB (MBOAT superfamily) [Mangrovibacterium marinum]
MLFNSIEFVLFFPIVLLLYWFVFNRLSPRARNLFLIACSYLFYAWWDYRFLSLIILSSLVDYYCGIQIEKNREHPSKRAFLYLSILINLGILFFFKYHGFFISELLLLLNSLGMHIHRSTLSIMLPIGISFYTFQTMSYTIDVYRKQIKATHDLPAFLAFVSFFPQLVAGPIERARHLLPQFRASTVFNYQLASNGFRQLLWGLFAKIAVADSVAPVVDHIFSNSATMSASSLAAGAVLFSLQIYGDFAGYSNIAIGTAALLGFDLMQNFNVPYFSRNMREFWTRWHISLSSWFRDYLYIPLGGNRRSRLRHRINVMATFLLSGLWHGANWTFLAWGTLHGIIYLLTYPFARNTRNEAPQIRQLPAIAITFGLVCFTFIFFRAETIAQAARYIARMMTFSKGLLVTDFISSRQLLSATVFPAILIGTEWLQRHKKHGLDLSSTPSLVRHLSYYLLISAILFCFQSERIFIYFQF